MLDEQLKAQREAAVRFGMNQPEIEKLQKTTRFARAEDFMRVGNKSRALRLMLTNPGGAKSLRTAGRMLLRLLTPHSILRRRIRSQQQQAFERYGTIEI
jgi:hypothetical protein